MIMAMLCGMFFCSCANAVRGPEQAQTEFLRSTGVDAGSKLARLPFAHSWREPSLQTMQYENLIIRPVTTRYLDSSQWELSKSSAIPDARSYQRQVKSLAAYWDRSLKKAFRSPISAFYLVQNRNKPKTLIMEVAMTEVVFGSPYGPLGIATSPDGIAAEPSLHLPMVAFEIRVRDAATGRLIATSADRRANPIDGIKASEKNVPLANQKICDTWSEQLMQASNRELFPKVQGSLLAPY